MNKNILTPVIIFSIFSCFISQPNDTFTSRNNKYYENMRLKIENLQLRQALGNSSLKIKTNFERIPTTSISNPSDDELNTALKQEQEELMALDPKILSHNKNAPHKVSFLAEIGVTCALSIGIVVSLLGINIIGHIISKYITKARAEKNLKKAADESYDPIIISRDKHN